MWEYQNQTEEEEVDLDIDIFTIFEESSLQPQPDQQQVDVNIMRQESSLLQYHPAQHQPNDQQKDTNNLLEEFSLQQTHQIHPQSDEKQVGPNTMAIEDWDINIMLEDSPPDRGQPMQHQSGDHQIYTNNVLEKSSLQQTQLIQPQPDNTELEESLPHQTHPIEPQAKEQFQGKQLRLELLQLRQDIQNEQSPFGDIDGEDFDGSAPTAVSDVNRKQEYLERTLDRSIEGLRKLTAFVLCQQATEEIAGVFEYMARVKRNDAPAERCFDEATPCPSAEYWAADLRTPITHDNVAALLRTIEPADENMPSTSHKVPRGVLPVPDRKFVEECGNVATEYHSALHALEKAIDADATESNVEFHDEEEERYLSLIRKNDEETQLLRTRYEELVAPKSDREPPDGNEDEEYEHCARTRFIAKMPMQANQATAGPTTTQCGCEWPWNCFLCFGRDDTTPSLDPNAMSMADSIARLNPKFHSILSSPKNISLSLHQEALAQLPRWQQSTIRACEADKRDQPDKKQEVRGKRLYKRRKLGENRRVTPRNPTSRSSSALLLKKYARKTIRRPRQRNETVLVVANGSGTIGSTI